MVIGRSNGEEGEDRQTLSASTRSKRALTILEYQRFLGRIEGIFHCEITPKEAEVISLLLMQHAYSIDNNVRPVGPTFLHNSEGGANLSEIFAMVTEWVEPYPSESEEEGEEEGEASKSEREEESESEQGGEVREGVAKVEEVIPVNIGEDEQEGEILHERKKCVKDAEVINHGQEGNLSNQVEKVETLRDEQIIIENKREEEEVGKKEEDGILTISFFLLLQINLN